MNNTILKSICNSIKITDIKLTSELELRIPISLTACEDDYDRLYTAVRSYILYYADVSFKAETVSLSRQMQHTVYDFNATDADRIALLNGHDDSYEEPIDPKLHKYITVHVHCQDSITVDIKPGTVINNEYQLYTVAYERLSEVLPIEIGFKHL